MNLTEDLEVMEFPATHYVFIEKTGPIMKIAPEAWQLAHGLARMVAEHNQITSYMSLYRMNPGVYRAGFALQAAPVLLPSELTYEQIEGGKYTRFVLTGPFSNLPQATGRAWELVAKNDIMLRPDFAIEHYLNDPRVTPEDKLQTEILIPTA